MESFEEEIDGGFLKRISSTPSSLSFGYPKPSKFLCPISKMESSTRGSEHRFLREFSVGNADTVECMEKLKKYETAYARRLKAKYFSKKAFNGGDIFDLETTVDNETIKSSRWPCTRSFADPIQTVEDPSRPPTSVAETSSTPNKKTPTKKSC